MKYVFLLAIVTLATSLAHAETTICKVEESISIKTIAWDKSKNRAKVTDHRGNTYEGKVTLTRKHDDGIKTNILVTYEEPLFGSDASEYIVFPINKNEHRVIRVTYVIRNNEHYLNSAHGSKPAACVNMRL